MGGWKALASCHFWFELWSPQILVHWIGSFVKLTCSDIMIIIHLPDRKKLGVVTMAWNYLLKNSFNSTISRRETDQVTQDSNVDQVIRCVFSFILQLLEGLLKSKTFIIRVVNAYDRVLVSHIYNGGQWSHDVVMDETRPLFETIFGRRNGHMILYFAFPASNLNFSLSFATWWPLWLGQRESCPPSSWTLP